MEAKHNKELEYQNAYICGDCLDVLRGVPDNSIDLIMTSPPYADQIKDYGDVVKKIKPDDYIEWFLPRAQEFLRVLKPEGRRIRMEQQRPQFVREIEARQPALRRSGGAGRCFGL